MAKIKNRDRKRQFAEDERHNLDQENDVDAMIKLIEMKRKMKSYGIKESIKKALLSFKLEFALLCILAAFDKMIIPTFI